MLARDAAAAPAALHIQQLHRQKQQGVMGIIKPQLII